MTAREYAVAWQKRARDYGPAVKREFRAIGELALQISDRLLTQEVYSKPEDRTLTGRYKWRRTNYLAVSERLRFEDDGQTAVIENLAGYAEPRHEANKPGRRRINPYRTAHWRDDMLEILGQTVPERIARLSIGILREK